MGIPVPQRYPIQALIHPWCNCRTWWGGIFFSSGSFHMSHQWRGLRQNVLMQFPAVSMSSVDSPQIHLEVCDSSTMWHDWFICHLNETSMDVFWAFLGDSDIISFTKTIAGVCLGSRLTCFRRILCWARHFLLIWRLLITTSSNLLISFITIPQVGKKAPHPVIPISISVLSSQWVMSKALSCTSMKSLNKAIAW